MTLKNRESTVVNYSNTPVMQVAMVEVDLDVKTPPAILIPYAMLTALLICVHLFSLILATRLLPELEAYISNPNLNLPLPITKGNSWPVQLIWYLSNIVGVFLFLLELVLVAYVKFYPYDEEVSDRLHVGTATLVLVVTLSALSIPFIIIFFRSLSKKKIRFHEQKLEKALVLLETINQSSNAAAMDGSHRTESSGLGNTEV